jgi:hypothetical protein
MRILIGYSMRSGSTLLQYMLGRHQKLRAYSDVSSLPVLLGMKLGMTPGNVVVKPPDLVYLYGRPKLDGCFDRFVWLARDPRDSYLSSIESRYAYLFWRKGAEREGLDLGLLERWKRVYRAYFEDPGRWHLIRYEDLVANPEAALERLYSYLGMEAYCPQRLEGHRILSGGDYKINRHDRVHTQSAARHVKQMTDAQRAVFDEVLGQEMRQLGY